MKFSLVNLGCKVNRVEADSIGADLLAAGWESVARCADVAVVNTCTVTAEADRKTRKEVNRALERNPQATVFVIGCAAAIDPMAYEALSPRVRVVSKGRVVEECLACAHGAPLPALTDAGSAVLRAGDSFPTRVGVKVQDGCDNACTYCIVHVARGPASSVPVAQVAEDVRALSSAGVREVVLTGIDLGAYNSDGTSLADLVMHLRTVSPETRLRISSIEPHTLDESLIDVLAEQDGMVCRHLHVPLQSGSSKVLREMARRYTAQEYVDMVHNLRAAVPGLSLSTDCIVGFPGETDDDFAETVEVARACGFSRMHLFRYSRREGTPAALREDQVEPEVKARRMGALSSVSAELRVKDACSRVGTSELVLVESDGRGMTESYYEVALPGNFRRGGLVELPLRRFDEKDGIFNV